ncbi:hypothetical protein [Streptomyces sp. enrichment culture]|uniref:hypothetical protein n=1 Tax=Streptomyces sp. enrichment culture TaxID=1795815 RepID=UPI003F55EE51
MTRYRLSAAVALAASALLITGCGGTPPEQAAPGTVLEAAPGPSAQVRGLVLPLDRYLLSVNEIYLIESAKDVVTRDCMKQRGFDWEVIDDRGRYPDLRNRRRYGVIEMPVARTMGYRTNPRLMGSTDVTVRKMDREKRLGPAERKAATDPVDGCWKRAGDRLARGSRVDEDLVNKLNGSSLATALETPAVVRATRAWSACMKERGQAYDDFYAAAEDPRWGRSGRPTRAEKETAEADVACKERTGLVALLAETERGIQERGIRAHAAYFAELAAAKKRHLTAVREVLRGGRG